MNDIKMIVMDLDGTLLTKNQNILPYTVFKKLVRN